MGGSVGLGVTTEVDGGEKFGTDLREDCYICWVISVGECL